MSQERGRRFAFVNSARAVGDSGKNVVEWTLCCSVAEHDSALAEIS